MSRTRLLDFARWASFGVLLLAAVVLRERPSQVFDQAIIWVPTGVAIAGVYVLGYRAAIVVTIVTVMQRLLLHYSVGIVWSAALGSTAEALLGAFLLHRLRIRAECSRLRDVAGLLVVAGAAPLGSIFFSWVGRTLGQWPSSLPFYSGWDGWWRMNALGALAVVPFVLTWRDVKRAEWTPPFVAKLALACAAVVGVIFGTLHLVPPGTAGIQWLNLVLMPIVMYAAARFDVRATTLTCTLAAFTVAVATANGHGPFLDVVKEQRHVAVQLFELAFLAVPLAFGALIAERRAAEASGVRSDALRRSLQAALPDISYRLARDGTCLEVHVPPGVTPPVPPAKMVGRSIFDWFTDQHVAEQFRRGMRDAFDVAGPMTIEFEVEYEGRRQFREARCVRHGEDEVLAVVRDISDRKWSERTTAFEARVLGLVAAGRVPVDVYAAIVEGLEDLLPSAMCSILETWSGTMHVAVAPSLPAEFNAAVEGMPVGPTTGSCGAAASLGQTIVVADMASHPLWAPWREQVLSVGLRASWSVPIRDSAGTVLGTCAVYHGEVREPSRRELELAERAAAMAGIVLERARRIEALRRSQDLLESINRNVKEGLFRIRSDGQILYANVAFAQLFGFESPDVIGRFPLEDALVSPDRAAELFGLVIGQGHWINEEAECRRRDGSTFWALLSGTTVRSESGEPTHFDGAISDITARKELEVQLRQSQKMEAVGKLAGGVAHDFNNLLTVIYGGTDAIRSESDANPSVRAHAEQVLDAASRASRLTKQLLAYSRQQVLSPRVLDLTIVVDQMGGMLRRLIGEDYRLVIEHASGALWVRVDPSQIEQVLLNLLVNARDAMPDGGPVTIRTERAQYLDAYNAAEADLGKGPRALLTVRDEGTGMSADVQARAFDPFFTTKPLGQGTGLGLSTVYGIVKQSGGAVWLDSAVGEGTAARIALPIAEEPVPEFDAPVNASPGGQQGTLLVVEDEPGVRALVSMTLRRAGYVVLEAADGEWGLSVAAAHEGTIDLVVTDVVMPRLNGPAMATRLLAARPGLRFLFISGYPDDARTPQDFVGASGAFLAKPFTPSQLAHAVRVAMAGSAAASERS